ncbi:double-strand break repair protein AddB [Octadecabacter sp. R77987]|uniref:double-strand break repair protein AddB n=1 Tax=Octadecabacter sp. R77987 TaxID=3093874 RepID=UPI0036720470
MIFSPSSTPRLYGLPPGVDFGAALVDGLLERSGALLPHDFAKVEIYVNTRRMQRRLLSLFDTGPARLLPRVRLVTDLALDPLAADLPPPVAPLRRRLELSVLVSDLLDRQPDLAPRAALFDLSDSLAALMDEMQGEGVSPETIAKLDVTDQSGHWARALQFVNIAQRYFDIAQEAPDQEARQRYVIERLVARWKKSPPSHPVIVAGSTGSRGATALFMQAVAQLPQGAVVLPGYDFEMPGAVWDRFEDARTGEDHPQFRFVRLLRDLAMTHADVQLWHGPAPQNPRNALVSLALRPAPVTDQWQSEGANLGGLTDATDGLTLVVASSPRAEAEAIALRLRQALQDGITAALITPDRMLTRQVAAALERWDIIPDDSAGQPLPLSPPGRFLRHVADLFGEPLTGEALLTLLKHPLTHSGSTGRGAHLLRSRELELQLRRFGPPYPDAASLRAWAGRGEYPDPARIDWVEWLIATLDGIDKVGTRSLSDHVADHLRLASLLAAGPDAVGSGGLWDEAAGREAKRIVDTLALNADAGGDLDARDYAKLFSAILNTGEVRDRDKGHPQVLFWGTLEARVQSADLVILGSMNEGSWPEAASPDPWLNRKMRLDAGLLLPERRIGLAAHDFQQAVAGKEVWITRAQRSDEAETVPSRWVNRLTNLLGGLHAQGGPDLLAGMQARGDRWLAMAAKISAPDHRVTPALRPSPRPPVSARPKGLSVTQIKTLIRDPYAIYARNVLGLAPLDPLTPEPDAPLRGTIVHEILERFVRAGPAPDDPSARKALLQVAADTLDEMCPWPAYRVLWLARFERVIDVFLADDIARRAIATPEDFEAKGKLSLSGLDFEINGRADRIDRCENGNVILYDYKTGPPPSQKEQGRFDLQLLLLAAMADRGAFKSIGTARTEAAVYIGLGSDPKCVAAPFDEHPPDQVWSEFHDLIGDWMRQHRGYTARLAHMKRTDAGNFDHLSRFGEWGDGDEIAPEDLT